jgi:hypothetical protein
MKKLAIYVITIICSDVYSQIEPFVGVGITSYETEYIDREPYFPTTSLNVAGGMVFKDFVVAKFSFTKSTADGQDIWNNYGVTNATNKSFSVIPILLRRNKIKGGLGLAYLSTNWTFDSEFRTYSNKESGLGLSLFLDYRLNDRLALIYNSCFYGFWNVSYSNDIGISYRFGESYEGRRKKKITTY